MMPPDALTHNLTSYKVVACAGLQWLSCAEIIALTFPYPVPSLWSVLNASGVILCSNIKMRREEVEWLRIWNFCLAGYRKELLDALKPIQKSKKHGMFVDGCFHHCQAAYDSFWSGQHAPHVNGKVLLLLLKTIIMSRCEWSSCANECHLSCLASWRSDRTTFGYTDGIASFGRLVLRAWFKDEFSHWLCLSLQPNLSSQNQWGPERWKAQLPKLE